MQSFSVEHIEPRSRRGASTLDNLAFSCQGCNNFKYNKVEAVDPVSGQRVSLFHPRLHRWPDHFTWSEDYTQVIGISATGRATVEELRLNREGLLNLRELLYAAGKHPPPELE